MKNILSFDGFLNEDTGKTANTPPSENKPVNITKKGQDFSNKVKKVDAPKAEYKHMPCYEFVFNFIKEFIPNINIAMLNDFKMAYKKDIGSLKSVESLNLAKDSLKVPSMPVTMRGLEYANSKYNLGTIVPVDQAKVGDVISFWVYEFIEFSRKDKNFSFTETPAKLQEFITKNKIDINKLPEWLIEGVVLKYGHYGVISEVDGEYLYLTSSGEKNGLNGIWNGVSKADCSVNFTKISKSDLRKFQKMAYEDFLFKSTDEISDKGVQKILRSYILRFIK